MLKVNGDRFLSKALLLSVKGIDGLQINVKVIGIKDRPHTVSTFRAVSKEELEEFVGVIDPTYEKVEYSYNAEEKRHYAKCTTFLHN